MTYALPVMDQLLTAEDVADRLKMDISWVYRHKRTLRAVRLGARMWRFPERDLEHYLAEQREAPAAASTGERARTRGMQVPAESGWRVI